MAANSSGKESETAARRAFGEMLRAALQRGARAGGELCRWKNREFAEALGVDPRTVTNWLTGVTPPPSLDRLKAALFGEVAADDAGWRAFRDAYVKAMDRPTAGEPQPSISRPDAQAEAPAPAGLAPASPHFLGRGDDVAWLAPRLVPGAAMLVQGPPGIGKTELTRALAREVGARFGHDRRWFVALQAAPTAAEMQRKVAEAVGADPNQPFAATLGHLSRWPGLVVLDNLETPWTPAAERDETEATLAALASVAGVAVLASFRGRALVGGPAWIARPVGPLAPPFDAELFNVSADGDFSADPHFADFLSALGGVPLALRLIGRRAYGKTALAALWAEWRRKGAAAAVDSAHAKEKLGNLAVSIALSLDAGTMTPAANRLFGVLGALPGGLGPGDREALGGQEIYDAEEVLLHLGLAIERDDRLDLLAPIREFARVKRPPEGDDADLWRRHYLKLAQEIGDALGTEAGFGGMARLDPEFANIAAALAACLPDRRGEAIAAVPGFGRFAYLAGRPAPILAALAAACRRAGDARGEAVCLTCVGDIALARSQLDAARAAYEQALPLYRSVGDVLGEANCIGSLGDIALRRSQHDAARAAFDQALPLYRSVSAALGEANCILCLGHIALRRSQHDDARAAYERALPLYRSVGDVLGEANCIWSLGDIALDRSQHDAARAAYEQALPMYRQVGTLRGEGNVHLGLGVLALAEGDAAAARAAFETARDLYCRFGDPVSVGLADEALAALGGGAAG